MVHISNYTSGGISGRIQYEFSPDFGRNIQNNTNITIKGQIIVDSFLWAGSGWFYINSLTFQGHMDGVGTAVQAYMNIPISINRAGVWVSFSTSTNMTINIAEQPNRKNKISFVAIAYGRYSPDGSPGNEYTYSTAVVIDNPLCYYSEKYPLNIKVEAFNFNRATIDGTSADDGQYIVCKKFKCSMNSQAKISDIKKCTINIRGTDEFTNSYSLDSNKIEAIFSEEGYIETTPNIFSSFISALGADYNISCIIGDEYETTISEDLVSRSFARMHFSGRTKGGVAIGMFSSSTDDTPKFEVAENHESFLYGGIYCVNNYYDGEHKTGGHWIDGLPIYRYSFKTANWMNFPANMYSRVCDIPCPISTLINFTMFLHRQSDSLWVPIPWACPGATVPIAIYIDSVNSQIMLCPGKDSSFNGVNVEAVVIMDYTREQDFGYVERPAAPMWAAEAANCKVTSNSVYTNKSGRTYWPFYAFNDILDPPQSCYVAADNVVNPYLQLEMDVALKNIKVEIYSCVARTDSLPRTGKIEGSNNGNNWYKIGEFSDIPQVYGTLQTTVTCTNSGTAYRYVRITFSAWYGSSTNRLIIGNINIFGDLDKSISSSPSVEQPSMSSIQPVDPNTARIDYISMMTNITIPIEESQAKILPSAETVSNPNTNGSPTIEESQIIHSKKFDIVKLYYDAKVWNEQMVKDAIDKWITKEEYEEIIK